MSPDTSSDCETRFHWKLYVVFPVIVVATSVGVAYYALRSAEERRQRAVDQELQTAIAEVDKLEPNGWQLADLEKQRKPVPDEENGAKVVQALAERLPKDWEPKTSFAFERINEFPPPVVLEQHTIRRLNAESIEVKSIIGDAQRLRDFPNGRFPPIRWTPNYFSTNIPQTQVVRKVVAMLLNDALLKCHQKKYEAAWHSTLAALNAMRSFGDEPCMLSQVCRIGYQLSFVRVLERILAHGPVSDVMLAKAIRELETEVDCDPMRIAMHAERAAQHHFFSNLLAKKVDIRKLIPANDDNELKDHFENGALPEQTIKICHANTLEVLTKIVEAMKKNAENRMVVMGNEYDRAKWELSQNKELGLSVLLLPDFYGVENAYVRSFHSIHCAMLGLSAERFRFKYQRWPKSLGELNDTRLLPKESAKWIKSKNLRLRRTKDGLVFYKPHQKYYSGTAWDHLGFSPEQQQLRMEFRIWDEKHRRQPMPEVKLLP